MRRRRQFISGLAYLICHPAAAAPAATYHHDIAPILREYCVPCHQPGQAGPFPLLTYEDARKRAGQIASVTRRRYMPPWLPDGSSPSFAGEHRLSDAQIAAITSWAAAGAPQGGAETLRPVRKTGSEWQLGNPDLVVQATKPFVLPADGPDTFWNFVLSPPVRSTQYVKAIEIRPGNTRVVHHANLLLDRSRTARHQERVAGEGFAGMDLAIESDTFDPDSHFLFWKPGGTPQIEPAGMAWRLDPGNDLVLNVHLQPGGKPEPVQPSVGIYFSDSPQTKYPMLVQLDADGALRIPAGARDFVVTDDLRLPMDVDVLAIYPHAHYLGHLLESFATLPDGSRQTLIRIPAWDPNWQAVYTYRSPVFLPKGTMVSMRFHYDNSTANPRNPNSPPKAVNGGNQSTDEMAHLWLQLLPRGKGDQRRILQEALMQRRLEKYPADFSAHFNLGALLMDRGDLTAAAAHLRDALRATPQQPLALNALGVALERNNHSEEAAENFREALRVQPDYTDARYNLANWLAANGRMEEAAVDFRQVMAERPGDAAVRERLIATLTWLGEDAAAKPDLAGAVTYYRELVELAPADADLHNNYGIVLARSGKTVGAIEQFQVALKINPAHPAALRNLQLVQRRP